jgi:predicted dehydrogenase
MSYRTSRRRFLQRVAAAGAALPVFMSSRAKAQDKHPDLRVAFIGTGGMGGGHVEEMSKIGVSCPCYCDVDTNNQGKAKEKYPNATAYQDYRRMFDKEARNIDAVMVGTPDHHHFPATIIAMQLGINVYTQKPLTQTVWEARILQRAAKRYNVVTQMGNQGHAGEDWRRLYEIIHAGGIGDVKAVHTWTDRPIWPQGIDRPEGSDPVPPNLDWDVWLGPGPVRPFKSRAYHPFVWRGWWDYGAGALGDMACHTMDGMFWSLDPGWPTAVEPVVINNKTAETFPNSSIIKWEFPAKGDRLEFVQYWYDGGLKPDRPADLEEGRELPGTGNLFVGTKGTLIIAGDYGSGITTIPEPLINEIGDPPKLLERSPGHYIEWVLACKGEGKTWSNFDYAAPMTETILLGNVAVHVGERIEWDGEKVEITNLPDANRYINKDYRDGWKVW